MTSQRYLIPAQNHRLTTTVVNSRFISTAACVASVQSAKDMIAQVRAEMLDASHHVYAFRVGYGNSIIEGMSDDGEPTGTAAPPILSVLRGSGIGDILIVVTRYFGGTKLGTGGLVRAYGDAARATLETLPLEEKIPRKTLGVELSYPFYESIKRLIATYNGSIEDQVFASDITIIARLAADDVDAFSRDVSEVTAGRVQIVMLSET